MKKNLFTVFVVLLAIAMSCLCFGCKDEGSNAPGEVDVNIAAMRNEMTAFNKTNDIWMFPRNYEGQTVCIKGTYSVGKLSGAGDDKHRFVGVYDGCCTWAYLTFVWDGAVPATGKTVTVTGKVHRAVSNGVAYAEIEAESVSF